MVDSARIAMVGYCFGGTVAVEFAGTGVPVVGTVAMELATMRRAKSRGRFLILHGASSDHSAREVYKLIKDFRAAQVEWQMEVYSGTEHGFSAPKNTAEQRANTLSQAAMARFFSDIFGN